MRSSGGRSCILADGTLREHANGRARNVCAPARRPCARCARRARIGRASPHRHDRCLDREHGERGGPAASEISGCHAGERTTRRWSRLSSFFSLRPRARPDGARAFDRSARCALARSSEIDDIHLPSMTTPGGVVIPAALTLAATAPTTTVEDLTAAILAGYEAMTRLGRALDGPSILYRGIWPTYFAAPFAVPAVAGRIFNFEARETANALALALTLSAPGVGAHHGETTARWFAIGKAATKGLTAALAAQRGFSCDLDLLAGNFFPQIYGISPQVGALTDGLGKQSTRTEVSFKPWCAARQTMAATQALLEIIESGMTPQSIDSIRAFVLPPHRKMIDHGVKEGDRASHLTSVQYQMAAAALGEPPK